MKIAAIGLSITLFACSETPRPDAPPADSAPPATAPQPALPAADSGAPKLLPVDQADASFRAFRERLLQALARRDTVFLYSILAPEIKSSFGGDDRIAGFRRIWDIDSPQSELWATLTRVLRMGGKLDEDMFTAPYVFAFWPDSIDAFEYVAITRESATLHAAPDATSNMIGIASYSILKREIPADSDWWQVDLPAGATGWVRSTDAYSPVDWRAIFRKRDGRWLMLTLIAGD